MSQFFAFGYTPDLEFGVKPTIDIRELVQMFEDNLSEHALKKLNVLKLWCDLQNLQKMLLGKELDPRGSFSKEALEEFLEREESLPEYVFSFFEEYESVEDRVRYFPKLITTYFQEEIKKQSGFLRKFLQFEHDFLVLMAGVRAKKIKRDLEKELVFEDMQDPLVRFVVAQKGSPGKFVFPFEYLDLEKYLTAAGASPTKQYLQFAKYRFDFYAASGEMNPYSLEGIFAYFMRLWILEDLFLLNQEEGETLLDNLVENQHAS